MTITLPGKLLRMLAYALPHWPALLLIVALTVAGGAVAALQPWPLKILIDYGLSGSPLPEWALAVDDVSGFATRATTVISAAAIAAFIVFMLSALLDALVTLAWSRVGQRMVYSLATVLFFQLQRLSLLFHAQRSVGDALSRVTGDAWTVYTVTENVLIAPARNCVVVVSVSVLAWQLSPTLTTVMLLAVPLLAVSMFYFGKRLKRAEAVRREAQARLTSFVHQILGAIPVVQAFGAGARNMVVFGAIGTEVVHARQKAAVLSQSYSALNGIATTIGVALVVYVGGQQVLGHQLSVGALVVFVAYVRSLESATTGLLQIYGALRTAEASVDRVLEVLDAREIVTDSPHARKLPARESGASGRIVFDDVTFGYEPEHPILRSLSLDIAPGETVALVGASGAGKTTIASLVPRLFDPWTGRVLLDGLDLREIELSNLRSELGIVLQDPFLLPLSILDNIAYGRPDASRDDVVAAAVAANAHEFIRQLPEGYETVLAEHGSTLSGGQQQRVAIARALLKNPRVLILDEPTAALDTETERLLMEALERLMLGRTTLIIAHRLATVRAARRIAVIDGGHIAEIGTHEQLLAAGGRYAALYALTVLGNAAGGLT